jgi:diadenosine tetraphosphate (Ap4A) HIT family hydrolase
LYQPEINALHSLLREVQATIIKADPNASGINVGTNAGFDAGQTVLHCQVDLIRRRKGDVDDPRSIVRGVIQGNRFAEWDGATDILECAHKHMICMRFVSLA